MLFEAAALGGTKSEGLEMTKLGTSRNMWMKRTVGGLAAGSIVLALAPTAGANPVTQVVTGSIGSSVAISTAPTSAVSLGAMPAAGQTQVSGGSIAVTANLTATITLAAEKATMTHYANGAYADGAPALATPMAVTPALTAGTGVAVPVSAVGTTATPIATGIVGSATFSLNLVQVTVVADDPTTYRNTLTYTAAAAL